MASTISKSSADYDDRARQISNTQILGPLADAFSMNSGSNCAGGGPGEAAFRRICVKPSTFSEAFINDVAVGTTFAGSHSAWNIFSSATAYFTISDGCQ